MSSESAYFVKLGGRKTIERVHNILYGKIYSHPWLKQFFVASPREHQESQQNDFMVSVLGGPAEYSGRVPGDAHPHLFITEEVFDIRHALLIDSIREANIPDELAVLWLKSDEKFRNILVKKSIDECSGRYKNEPIIAPYRP